MKDNLENEYDESKNEIIKELRKGQDIKLKFNGKELIIQTLKEKYIKCPQNLNIGHKTNN